MYHPHRTSPPPNQSSLIPAFNLDDDDFKPLWSSASQPSQHMEGPSEPGEDDSPVEEVAAVKPKRKYTRRRQPITKDDKEFVEPWTPEEDVALCKAWVHAKEAIKKGSSSGARLESSGAGEHSLVDALLSKFTMAATPFFSSRKESSSEYLRIKERELELEDQRRREQGELKRLKIAQRDKELELQQKMF
ncbi:hypothetical protein Tco_0952809 [Tanacetum coccineum]|uniref:No apical meristem-associated C-terminal domain-containing protein n=1 Tax=Tanacetum coccineum TaxID=301880 RepID=A0ABQ5E3S4_9ASTR